MEVVSSVDVPGGNPMAVSREENLAELSRMIEQISRGSREALLKLLGVIRQANPPQLGILQVRAAQAIHGKTVLHEIWCVIQTSGLSRDDRYCLLDFLDRHRFRMRNENLKQALSKCRNC